MQKTIAKKEKRKRRHGRIRAKVSGTAARPRLSMFKSNRMLYAQLIDDENGVSLLGKRVILGGGKGIEGVRENGKTFAEEAKKKGVSAIVFDRGGYLYIGTVKAFAEGVREGGLAF